MTDKKNNKPDLQQHYTRNVKPFLRRATWLLRVTEHKDKSGPVLIVKERVFPNGSADANNKSGNPLLHERGLLYGQPQRRCLPVLRGIISRVEDEAGIPLELHRFLSGNSISFRGNLPLSEEAGYKLALIFKLRARVMEMDRIELIARRVARFTREEAAYWHSRMTNFGEVANRWAVSGMRTILGGQPKDKGVQEMLERLREGANSL